MGTYERLSVQDRLFLDVEDPTSNMHIAGCFTFEAGPLSSEGLGIDIDRIRQYIESRLYRVPRYRQRIEYTPYEGHPIWVDDASFNIRYHVRHTRLPLPGDERQLKRLCGRVVSQQLDRDKPLWEIWVVEGLDGDRIALITKVHHCLADGISGVDLLQNLLSEKPLKEFEPAPTWLPQPAPEPGELVFDAVARRARTPLVIAEALLGAARDPRGTVERALETIGGLQEMLALESNPASETPLNRTTGPHRRYDWLSFDLDEMKRVRQTLGGTLNDLVLAIVTRAVGRFLARRGVTEAEQRALDFRIACPVNLRRDSDRNTYGNQLTMIYVKVPIDERDPVRLLERVRETVDATKQSKQPVAMETLSEIGEWTSPALLTAYARRALRHRIANMVVTNVPGPRIWLYLLGARMLETYPVVPLMPEQAIAVALFSYGGSLHWGINSDWDLVPDLHDFVEALQVSYDEIRRASENVEEGDRAPI